MSAAGNKTLFGCLPLPPSLFDLKRGVRWSLATLSPPSFHLAPPHTLPHWDSFQLPRHILRMASNLEVMSIIADIGQQQWSCTIFRLSDRTLRSRVRNFVIWQELVEFQVEAWLLVAAWIWTISWHGRPVQKAGTVQERAAHKSRAAWAFSSLRDYMRDLSYIWGSERELICQTSSWRFLRA